MPHGESPWWKSRFFSYRFFSDIRKINSYMTWYFGNTSSPPMPQFVGKMAVPTGSSPAWLASSCSIDRQNIWPEIFKRLGPALMPRNHNSRPHFWEHFSKVGGGKGQSCGIAPWNDLRGSTHRLRVKWRFKLANDNLNWTELATRILPPSTVCRMSYVSWLSPTVLAHFAA